MSLGGGVRACSATGILLLAAATVGCDSSRDVAAERAYRDGVVRVFRSLDPIMARAEARCCQGGLLDCAAAADDALDDVSRARSELRALTPPPKLRGAHRRLVDGLGHLQEAFSAIRDTYWSRDQAYEAYVRSVSLVRGSMKDVAAAVLEIGVVGDRAVWGRG